MSWLERLCARNEILFWFGLANLALALLFFVLSRIDTTQVMGVNAWYKPLKFALSLGIFAWTMGWYLGDLGPGNQVAWYPWVIVLSLGFEILYIAWQAGRGEMSHFNLSSPLYVALYRLMAGAATVATLATALVGMKFWTEPLPHLPPAYLWAIRLGIVLFVVFSFQGFLMGARLRHSVGGPDGGPGLPFLNWSLRYGDLRIAHFVGMHALQVLPVLAHVALREVRSILLVSVLYGLLAVALLGLAWRGKPLPWPG